jgi:hypothetical protein
MARRREEITDYTDFRDYTDSEGKAETEETWQGIHQGAS